MKRSPFRWDSDLFSTPLPKIALGILLIGFCRLVDTLFLLFRPRLLICSLRLLVRGLIRSPYAESGFHRVHLARRANLSKRELVYGETPVFTAVDLFRRSGLNASGSLLDLGAGRGRVLIAARVLGAEARGIELLPEHIHEATAPLSHIGASIEQGRAQDFRQKNATHIYIAWTCMGEQNRHELLSRLLSLRGGTIVMVVTWPIEHAEFSLMFKRKSLFSWGICDLYVYERVHAGPSRSEH